MNEKKKLGRRGRRDLIMKLISVDCILKALETFKHGSDMTTINE